MRSTCPILRETAPLEQSSRYLIATRPNAAEGGALRLLGLIVLLVMALCLALLAISAYTHPEHDSVLELSR